MPVPFLDLKRETIRDLDRFQQAAERVFRSGVYSLGPEVEAFERAFAQYLGVKHVVAVYGGTMALYAVLLAMDIGSGDEVIVPTNSFIASAEAVIMAGATPVFCDIDPVTHLFNEEDIKARKTSKTKAVIPVHLYGRVANLGSLKEWADACGIRLIEDACQAHGASLEGKMAGSIGDAGCFSFYPTKNLGALGEGGAVATDNDEIAERVRGIRVHGCLKEKYRHDIFGTNLKMDALQGAFLSIKLEGLSQANIRREQIAQRYQIGFEGTPLGLPAKHRPGAHAYHLYVVTCENRDALQAALQVSGIQTAIHYPTPIHLQPAFRAYSAGAGSLPQAEAMSGKILSLPLFPTMTDAEVDEVIAVVRAFYQV